MADDPRNVEKMIAGMNSHAPASRRSLLDYMGGEDLTYKTRSGEICDIERGEIDYLAANCSEMEKMRLRLPIFITTDITGEESAWKVDGVTESKIVARLLGKVQFREDSIRFYHPDLVKLTKTLPSATVVMYLP